MPCAGWRDTARLVAAGLAAALVAAGATFPFGAWSSRGDVKR